jgi:hypothetical protein
VYRKRKLQALKYMLEAFSIIRYNINYKSDFLIEWPVQAVFPIQKVTSGRIPVMKGSNYQKYNKKKKPWRSLKWAGFGKCPKVRLKKYLCLIACLEAAIIFPQSDFFSVSRETETAGELMDENDGKIGETREQGLSVDWKDGTVKFWNRVERVVLKEQD